MKTFILPFKLDEKEYRTIFDAQNQEVVVFPKGCELLAAKCVNLLNNDNSSYVNDSMAGDIAKIMKIPVGMLGCPHCGNTMHGAIVANECPICENKLFDD